MYYGKNDLTLDLQIAYADFLAYYYNQPEKAISLLNEVIPLARSKFQKGSIQIKLADIFKDYYGSLDIDFEKSKKGFWGRLYRIMR